MTFKARLTIANALLASVIVVPIVSTLCLGTIETNNLTACLQALFVLAMLPETLRQAISWWQRRSFRIAVVVAVFCMVSWQLYQGPFLDIARLWVYLSLTLFFAATVCWFKTVGDKGGWLVFYLKSLVTFAALLIFAITIFTDGTSSELFVHPPIYRHLRHLNYDLVAVIALAVPFWSKTEAKGRYYCATAFIVLGYFSFWSGGRGEAVALIVFVLALISFGVMKWNDRLLVSVMAALLLGGGLVVASGQTRFLSGQLERSAASSANEISSGRLRIWKCSLERAEESPASLLFGFGPDAFERLRVFDDVWPNGHAYIVHPHNAVVQWLLEFGAVGTSVILLFLIRTGAIAVAILRQGAPLNFAKAVSALLLALFCYSMTDGLFYHAVPLTFITLLISYLHARRPDLPTSSTDHASHSTPV